MDERVKIGAVAGAVETHLGVRPGRIVAFPESRRSIWEVETSAGTVVLKSGRSRLLMLEAWAYVKVREAGVPVPEVLAVEPHGPPFLDGYVITTKVPGISKRPATCEVEAELEPGRARVAGFDPLGAGATAGPKARNRGRGACSV